MKILISKTGYWRKPDLRVRTDIIEENKKIYVKKTTLGVTSQRVLEKTIKSYPKLQKISPKNVFFSKPIKHKKNEFIFEFATGKTLQKLIEDALIARNFQKAEELFYRGCEVIESLSSSKMM